MKSSGGHLEARVAFGSLLVNPTDLGIGRELLVYGVHEPVVTTSLRRFLKEGMIVVDAGANVGYYVLEECNLVGETGRVIAIEPEPENYALLGSNVVRNTLRNVTLVHGAVGNSDGHGTMYLSELSNRHTMIAPTKGERECIGVDVFKIDTLVQRLGLPSVDCVRMDIEGYEIEAMDGMMETLRKFRPILVMELHPDLAGGERIAGLLQLLHNLDYETELVMSRYLDNPWIEERSRTHSANERIETLIHDRRILGAAHAVSAIFRPTENARRDADRRSSSAEILPSTQVDVRKFIGLDEGATKE